MPTVDFTGLQNTIVVFQGRKGSGKTNAVKTETDKLNSCYFVDIRNEYNHVPKYTDKIKFIQALVAYQHNRIPGEKITKASLTFHNRTDYIEIFQLMKGFGNTNIVFDEADTLFQDRKMEPALIDVMLGARNNNVNLFYCTKRPFLIPIAVRSQADVFLVFRTKEKRDVDYLEANLPNDSTFPIPPRNLKQGQCIIISDGTEEVEVRQYDKYVPEKKQQKHKHVAEGFSG